MRHDPNILINFSFFGYMLFFCTAFIFCLYIIQQFLTPSQEIIINLTTGKKKPLMPLKMTGKRTIIIYITDYELSPES